LDEAKTKRKESKAILKHSLLFDRAKIGEGQKIRGKA